MNTIDKLSYLVMMIGAYVRLFVHPTIALFALSHKIPANALQGAYWGTAYAAYSLIYTPGYGVHTWNLHNKDLIKPLYVSFISLTLSLCHIHLSCR